MCGAPKTGAGNYRRQKGFQAALPTVGRYLNYRFGNDLSKVGVTGFEPATFCTPCRRASQVTLHPEFNATNANLAHETRRLVRSLNAVASMSKSVSFGNPVAAPKQVGRPETNGRDGRNVLARP